MQHQKCLSCERLGTSCNCMSFVKMSPVELIEWCKAMKQKKGLTNEGLANLSGVPLGTVNRFLTSKNIRFHYDTAQSILNALVSGEWSEDNCLNIQDMGELTEHNKDIVSRLETERDFLKQEVADIRAQAQNEIKLLLPLLKFRKNTIVVLGSLLGIALSLIIGALIIDSLNPNVGFFWLS